MRFAGKWFCFQIRIRLRNLLDFMRDFVFNVTNFGMAFFLNVRWFTVWPAFLWQFYEIGFWFIVAGFAVVNFVFIIVAGDNVAGIRAKPTGWDGRFDFRRCGDGDMTKTRRVDALIPGAFTIVSKHRRSLEFFYDWFERFKEESINNTWNVTTKFIFFFNF